MRSLLVATALATVAFAQAESLQISAVPLFLGLPPITDHYPILIKVQNLGSPTRGEVLVQGSDLVTSYPVDLPSGTLKSFIAYVAIQDYEPLKITLDTDNGTVIDKVTIPPSSTGRPIITIASTPGGLSYLRGQSFTSQKNNQSYNPYMGEGSIVDLYATPEKLPDRSIGYDTVWAVLLSQGSERMSDAAAKALHNYVLTGGMVVFLGGASPQILRDPRFADLLPVADISTQTISNLRIKVNQQLPSSGAAAYKNTFITIDKPVTIAAGTLAPGAEATSLSGSTPIIARKPYGAGTAIFFAANPFEEPITKIDNRHDLMGTLMSLEKPYARNEHVLALANQLAQNGTAYYSNPAYTSMGYSAAGRPATTSPFSVTLPPTTTIFAILLAYALLVAPINLFILRKFKRGEWAWWTAPIVSLGFAALFFNFAAGLYTTMLSKQTDGLVLADASSNNAYFIGDTQLFFPRGGRYNLGIKNADYVTGADDQNYYPYGGGAYSPRRYRPYRGYGSEASRMSSGINPVDVGQVLVPAMSANNLSFYQLQYGQRLDLAPPVTAHLVRSVDHIKGEVKNNTRFKLNDAILLFDDQKISLGAIEAGATKTIDNNGSLDMDPEGGLAQLAAGRMLFNGKIEGFVPGVQIGQEAPGGKVALIENLTGATKS